MLEPVTGLFLDSDVFSTLLSPKESDPNFLMLSHGFSYQDAWAVPLGDHGAGHRQQQ